MRRASSNLASAHSFVLFPLQTLIFISGDDHGLVLILGFERGLRDKVHEGRFIQILNCEFG